MWKRLGLRPVVLHTPPSESEAKSADRVTLMTIVDKFNEWLLNNGMPQKVTPEQLLNLVGQESVPKSVASEKKRASHVDPPVVWSSWDTKRSKGRTGKYTDCDMKFEAFLKSSRLEITKSYSDRVSRSELIDAFKKWTLLMYRKSIIIGPSRIKYFLQPLGIILGHSLVSPGSSELVSYYYGIRLSKSS
jgi:hypothetical protein